MICPNCQRLIPDDGLICPYCGSQVAAPAPQYSPVSNPTPISRPAGNVARKGVVRPVTQHGTNNALTIAIIVAAVLVACVIGVIAYFVYTDKIAKEESLIEVPESIVSDSDNGVDESQYDWLSERAVTAADLAGKTSGDLRLMRNAIFARHGYIFKSADLTDYFSNFSWYTPRHKDVTPYLSKVEQQNIAFINKFENGTPVKSSVASVPNAGRVYDYSDYVVYTRLTPSELAGLSKSDLRIMRNTIYARHGYIFKSDDLTEYFSNFSWYKPRYSSLPLDAFSDVERHNIELIQKYE